MLQPTTSTNMLHTKVCSHSLYVHAEVIDGVFSLNIQTFLLNGMIVEGSLSRRFFLTLEHSFPFLRNLIGQFQGAKSLSTPQLSCPLLSSPLLICPGC